MSKIILTGYEPFGEYESNPSSRIPQSLDGETIQDTTVVGRELPVIFDEAFPHVKDLIETHNPIAVVSTGLMPGREALTVERVGINIRDFDNVPDNAGAEPIDEPVFSDAPDAYFSGLPVRDLVNTINGAGVPARISNTAGTHLCNNILYATRHHVETEGLNLPTGFIHVPFSHEQVARRTESDPSMSLNAMEKGIRVALEYLIKNSE